MLSATVPPFSVFGSPMSLGTMRTGWVTDMRHFLTEDECLAEMPNQALSLALHFGAIVAWMTSRGTGTVTHFGTNPASVYASSAYYTADAAELLRLRDLARFLTGHAPIVSVAGAKGTAWARRVPSGGVFLFVGSRTEPRLATPMFGWWRSSNSPSGSRENSIASPTGSGASENCSRTSR